MAQTKVRFDRAVEGATNIVDSGTEGTKVAAGTTGQRGSTTGQWRYNTTTGFFEGRGASQFSTLEPTPTVSNVDVTEVDSQAGGNQTIVVTGTNFSSGGTITFVGNAGTDFDAATTTFNSATQVTAVAAKSSFLNAQEPYKVKFTSATGVAGTSGSGLISVDTAPTWTTNAGSLGSVSEQATGNHFTVAASDADSDTIAYSLQSGSLGGLSLNASTGVIFGDPTDVSNDTTNSFTLRATAGSKTVDRAFSFITTSIDGTTKAKAIPVSVSQNPVTQLLAARGESNGSITEGIYWTYSTNTNGDNLYSASVYRNISSNTYMLLQKNFVPHAYKNGDGVTSIDHPLSYGLIDAAGTGTVITNTNLGSSGSNSSASLGDYHARVHIQTFGDGVFSVLGAYDRGDSFGKITSISGSNLTTLLTNAQAYNNSFQSNAWNTYQMDGHNRYLIFRTHDTVGDDDYAVMGLTSNGSTGQDNHNNADEYSGITWYGDATSDYTGQSRDSALNGGLGKFSFWIR